MDKEEQKNIDKNSEIDELKKERDEYLDGWKRSKADFLNYKKEESKRVEKIAMFANEQIIKDILPVLDSFDLAMASIGENPKVEKGMYLIKSQMEDILKKFGLEHISVSVGDNFDPSLHEAVAIIEMEDAKPQTIIEEIESGYRLNGKLIRPVRVKVAK